MNNIPKKPVITSWGGVAEWYDDLLEQDPDSYQKNVLMPNLIRIIDPKKSMIICDVACGQGYFSRAFANNGASVIASDISPELVERAKVAGKKSQTNFNEKSTVEYHVAPSDKLTFVQDSSVDVVTIILALQNIENLQGTFSECTRVLKKGGKIVFVINHPAFRIPQRSSWEWTAPMKTLQSKDSGEAQYRRLDGYMSDAQIKIDMTPGEKETNKKKQTVSFHRPLQTYFKLLTKSGSVVTRFEEWISHKKSQVGPRSVEEDRMRKEIPMFLCVEATKL